MSNLATMTSTPESWDDVGSLRLQVDCISDKLGMNDSQLQKLSDEFALIRAHLAKAQQQEEKKQRCQMHICGVITAVFLSCVLAPQIYMICTVSAPKSTVLDMNQNFQKLSDEVWKTFRDDLKASEAELKPSPEPEVQRGWRDQKFIDAAGRAERAAGSSTDGPNDSQEAGKDAIDNWFETGKNNADGEQSIKVPGEDKVQFPQINLTVVVSEASSGGEKRESIKAIHDQPSSLANQTMTLPSSSFQNMSPRALKRFNRGVFYVCFPSSALKTKAKKYAQVFQDVSHSRKWMVYPFCYIDAKNLNEIYDERFCDEAQQMTFVLETSRSDLDSSTKNASGPLNEIPIQSRFDSCLYMYSKSPQWFSITSSVRFRRMFPPNQDVQASLVEEFLSDVYSGKLQEVVPFKRDL